VPNEFATGVDGGVEAGGVVDATEGFGCGGVGCGCTTTVTVFSTVGVGTGCGAATGFCTTAVTVFCRDVVAVRVDTVLRVLVATICAGRTISDGYGREYEARVGEEYSPNALKNVKNGTKKNVFIASHIFFVDDLVTTVERPNSFIILSRIFVVQYCALMKSVLRCLFHERVASYIEKW